MYKAALPYSPLLSLIYTHLWQLVSSENNIKPLSEMEGEESCY